MKTLRDYIDLVDQKFNQALSEKVTLPADGSAPVTQTVTTPSGATFTGNAPANAIRTGSGGVLTTGNGAAVTSGTPAPAPDAVAAAKAKLTPSQLKWLGGADATDTAIMARMPKPLPGEAVPGAAPAQAAQAAPAAPAAPDTAGAYDDEGNMMPGWSKDENGNPVKVADQDGKTFVEPATQASADKSRADAQAATQKANGVDASGNNVTMANGINPETGEPSTPQTAAAPAQAAQAAPAGGKVPPQPTLGGKPSTGPKGQEWLKKYGATNNPDGSPKAAGAKPAAPGLDASGRANAAADPRVIGAKPAQAAQPAAAPAAVQAGPTVAAAQGKAPGNPLNQAPYNAAKDSQAANVAKESRMGRNDHKFIDELNAMRSIAGLPTKNKW